MITFIKKAVDQKMEKQSLIDLLDKRLAHYEEARSHKVIHISDLSRDIAFCPREFALLDITGKKPKGQFISTALQVTFDNGNALSDMCRNSWLKDDVVGNWKCLYCKAAVEFSKRPKTKCMNCNANLWKYEEFRFENPFNGASGSIDFFMDFGMGGKHVLVEVKTMSKDMFKELKAPLAEHRIRTQLYLLHMSKMVGKHADKIDLSRGIVLYISKGFGAKNEDFGGKVVPFKEFSVARDDNAVGYLYGRADAVQLFRKTGKMPVGICTSAMDKRAKSCAVAPECFSGKYI